MALNARGYRVFAGVRKPTDADSLRNASDGQISPIILDVTQMESVAAAFQVVSAEIGDTGLAGLVNNAGVLVFGPVEEVPIRVVEEQFRVNLFGVIGVTQRFLPLLRRARGRIVNMSSINGLISMPFFGIYSASKFALEAISDALRMELQPWGISVSIVEPGLAASNIRGTGVQQWTENLQLLSAEQRKLYEPLLEKSREIIASFERTAAGHEHVTRAVLDALTSEAPQTRSMVGPDVSQWGEMLKLPDIERDRALLSLLE
jgi:NAD(P)-dependent dehydrogenase (short-subunit alcohol dehydrogenase family)